MLKRIISTSQPLLCKPAEARIAKWQEQWEQTDSNLKRYNIDPKERLPSGHTLALPWRAWRTSNRVRSGQAATPAAKHLWGYRDNKNCMCGAATCDLILNHIIMTSCTHFGERPSLDDIAEMKDGYVRWLRAIADTIWWPWMLCDDTTGSHSGTWYMVIRLRLIYHFDLKFSKTSQRWSLLALSCQMSMCKNIW